MVMLSAAEHLCLTWMIRETVHAGWSQDFSLGKLTDAPTDEGPVVDGDAVAHAYQATFAAIPNEPTQADAAIAEKRAMALMVAMGKDLARYRRLPVVAANAIRLDGIRLFADLSAAPVRLEWLRLLAARTNMTLADGESSLKWLYGLARLAPLLAHATIATLPTQMGSEVAWRAAVAKVRPDGTIDAADRAALAAAAAGAGAAAAAAAPPVRGANQYDAAKRPNDYSAAFVARLLVAFTQADVDGSIAAVPPVAGTINVAGSGAAKVNLINDLATVLQEMHTYTAEQLVAQARRALPPPPTCVGGIAVAGTTPADAERRAGVSLDRPPQGRPRRASSGSSYLQGISRRRPTVRRRRGHRCHTRARRREHGSPPSPETTTCPTTRLPLRLTRYTIELTATWPLAEVRQHMCSRLGPFRREEPNADRPAWWTSQSESPSHRPVRTSSPY